jgi:hypothetical protein
MPGVLLDILSMEGVKAPGQAGTSGAKEDIFLKSLQRARETLAYSSTVYHRDHGTPRTMHALREHSISAPHQHDISTQHDISRDYTK